MAALPTKRVRDALHPAGFVRINECDFDPAVHEEWAEPVETPPPAVPPPEAGAPEAKPERAPRARS